MRHEQGELHHARVAHVRTFLEAKVQKHVFKRAGRAGPAFSAWRQLSKNCASSLCDLADGLHGKCDCEVGAQRKAVTTHALKTTPLTCYSALSKVLFIYSTCYTYPVLYPEGTRSTRIS